MATVEIAPAAHGLGNPNRKPYLVQNTLDFAAAVTSKGSALAQGDIIQALSIPAKTIILTCGAEVMSAMTGTSTDLTLDIGFTGGNTDFLADGFDFDGAAVGAFTSPIVAELPLFNLSADTLDILLATQTGTLTGGKLRVWVVLMDVSTLGADDREAAEVDRDQLA